jgi:hypothetical protein
MPSAGPRPVRLSPNPSATRAGSAGRLYSVTIWMRTAAAIGKERRKSPPPSSAIYIPLCLARVAASGSPQERDICPIQAFNQLRESWLALEDVQQAGSQRDN